MIMYNGLCFSNTEKRAKQYTNSYSLLTAQRHILWNTSVFAWLSMYCWVNRQIYFFATFCPTLFARDIIIYKTTRERVFHYLRYFIQTQFTN